MKKPCALLCAAILMLGMGPIAVEAAKPVCTDGDNDTYSVETRRCGPVDCDDSDASVNPGATEVCDDTIDNDCDGATDGADTDGDLHQRVAEGQLANPWSETTLPTCQDCHSATGENNMLHAFGGSFLKSMSHKNDTILCSTCHGAPHALNPSTLAKDNVQKPAGPVCRTDAGRTRDRCVQGLPYQQEGQLQQAGALSWTPDQLHKQAERGRGTSPPPFF